MSADRDCVVALTVMARTFIEFFLNSWFCCRFCFNIFVTSVEPSIDKQNINILHTHVHFFTCSNRNWYLWGLVSFCGNILPHVLILGVSAAHVKNTIERRADAKMVTWKLDVGWIPVQFSAKQGQQGEITKILEFLSKSVESLVGLPRVWESVSVSLSHSTDSLRLSADLLKNCQTHSSSNILVISP